MINQINNLQLPKLGLGCGSMINFNNKNEYTKIIHTALDKGISLLNTADFYGSGTSEMIIGEALKNYKRENIFISLKFGALTEPNGKMYGLDVRPLTIKNYLTHSLKRLNVDYIDLFQPARIDLAVPVEEIINEMSKLVKEGYVKYIGLTQVDSETLKRAHSIHPISLFETEYSLFNRKMEKEILPITRELKIPIIAFGVLAHGLLGGVWNEERIQKSTSAYIPLFFKENIEKNILLVEKLQEIADKKQVTISQLAVAWMLSKGDDIIPLIGTSRLSSLEESIKALDISLSENDIKVIEDAIPENEISGKSFPNMKFRNGEVIR